MKIINGFKVCGYEDENALSGITVIFPKAGNTASVFIGGAESFLMLIETFLYLFIIN